MSEEKKSIEEIKEIVARGLDVCVQKLLVDPQMTFVATGVSKFEIVPTYSKGNPTAMTNGEKIFFDCEFYSTLDEEERKFVLAHEMWHNLFLHFVRQNGRDSQVWNIATDMEINHELVNAGMKAPKNVILPNAKVAGWNAEKIYEWLMQNKNQNQQKQSGNQNGGNNDSSSSSDNGNNDNQQGSSSSKGGMDENLKKAVDSISNGGEQFDKHMSPDGNGDNESDKDGNSEKNGGKFGEREDVKEGEFKSNADINTLESNLKDALQDVITQVERKQGTLPGGLKERIVKTLKPEINWKEVLSTFVTKCIGGDRSWSRCSRHGMSREMYLPGRTDENIKMLLAIDTSGSTMTDLPMFLGELKGLVESFGKYEVTVLQCDAEVQDVKEYSSDEPIDVNAFEMKGFGGTSFKPIFKWYNEHGGSEDYACILVFTDGYGDAPKYGPDVPVLWVLTNDGYTEMCDWGEKMFFRPQKKNR